jgi:hypothetical protein
MPKHGPCVSLDLRFDPRDHSRRSAGAGIGLLACVDTGREPQRLELAAHRGDRTFELHGHTGQRAHLPHVRRQDVHHLTVERHRFGARLEHQLHAHMLTQLERPLAGDEDAAVAQVRGVLPRKRLGMLEADP